jgi:ectoine hydroxylase-related dioxygenase (phytanoyl-CoA dioxygenase family)
MTLTSDQIARAVEEYSEEGYCVIRRALSPEAVGAIDAWLDSAAARARQTPTLEPEFEEGTDVVRKLRRLFWNDPGFWRSLFDGERVFDLARTMVSPSPALTFHASFMKPAGIGSKTAYHQDQALWSFSYPNAVNMWAAITPSTVENGCMRVCPGTHRGGLIEHGWLPDYPWHPAIDIAARGLTAEPVVMAPGDLLLWHRLSVHGSEENRSPHGRKGVVMVFVDTAQPDFRAKDQFMVPRAAAEVAPC